MGSRPWSARDAWRADHAAHEMCGQLQRKLSCLNASSFRFSSGGCVILKATARVAALSKIALMGGRSRMPGPPVSRSRPAASGYARAGEGLLSVNADPLRSPS
jgi:hypothetical protein